VRSIDSCLPPDCGIEGAELWDRCVVVGVVANGDGEEPRFDCWLEGPSRRPPSFETSSAGSLELPCSYDSGWWVIKQSSNVVDEKRI